MYGVVTEKTTYDLIDENEQIKLTGLYQKCKDMMSDFKKKVMNEQDKPTWTYHTFWGCVKDITKITKRAEQFYNSGAEHALKKPLNDMTEKIIDILDDETGQKAQEDEDVQLEDGILSFKRNLVPALPEDQFRELQQKLNSHQELSDAVTEKDKQIEDLKQQIEEFKDK